jgi:hypothetical protein
MVIDPNTQGEIEPVEIVRYLQLILVLVGITASSVMVKGQTPSENSSGKQLSIAAGEIESSTTPSKEKLAPVYTSYKGIALGMTAEEVRGQLDHLKEAGKHQDFFAAEDETARVFYDAYGKVKAISVDYLSSNEAPSIRDVFGEEVQPKSDGSLYQLRRYPEVGYWVAYNRTAGDKPIITVTMQKLP